MSNWKTDFEVKFRLEFIHENGRKEIKNNTCIYQKKVVYCKQIRKKLWQKLQKRSGMNHTNH